MKMRSSGKGFLVGLVAGILLYNATLFVLDMKGMLRVEIPRREVLTGISDEVNEKLEVIQKYIGTYFLDEIDQNQVADSVYKGLVDGLGDQYAAYYTKEEFKEISESTAGVFCGIGAYVTTNSGTGEIIIVQPMEKGPAKKAGVKAGDVVTEVDGVGVTGEDLSKVTAMMKGEKGTKVTLTISRKGKKKPIEIEIVRDQVEDETVTYKLLKDDLAYIQITGFEEVTYRQFKEAIEAAEKDNAKGLILDLRNNGGGLLSSAVQMLDRMLPEGLVVYTEDKQGRAEEYFAEDELEYVKPVVVMVNEYSASAAEVFSGALQDKHAATLVGTTTFGKGIVQTIFTLDDGTALKMTTSKYFTPNGRNIHGTGLTPDVEVAYDDDAKVTNNNGVKVDNQLAKGIETLNSMVY